MPAVGTNWRTGDGAYTVADLQILAHAPGACTIRQHRTARERLSTLRFSILRGRRDATIVTSLADCRHSVAMYLVELARRLTIGMAIPMCAGYPEPEGTMVVEHDSCLVGKFVKAMSNRFAARVSAS